MRLRNTLVAGAVSVSLLSVVYAFQRPWVEYPGVEYEGYPVPPDYQEKTEWVFARLMYPAIRGAYGLRGNPDWQHGRANWTIDYPRSDRHLSAAVRRLTRIHARSVEQCVNLDDGDEVYNWPLLYARRGRPLGAHRQPGRKAARLSAARRLLHVRRLPRHLASGKSSTPA